MKRVLFLCGTSQSVITFRSGFIKALQERGNKVSVIAFDDEYASEIKELNVDFFCIKDKNRSVNPLKILSLKRKYKTLIKKISPDIVFTFQLKPNTFGALGAKSAGIKEIYSMVEGIGDVFIMNTWKWRVIRFVVCKLYKKSFKRVKKVFFLNDEDKAEFLQRKLVKESQSVIIHGVGVDLEKFAFRPIKNRATFLMIARMLQTKGVYEYCKCARLVKQKYPEATFAYLGAEGTVKISDIQEYIDDGSICYLGTTKDVRPHIENCVVILLSSYREGLPMAIMEAEAMGRGVITSNNVGCKDTVVDGYNGFLIERSDFKKMAEKCIWAIENPDEVEELGKNARTFAEEHFDSKSISEYVCTRIGL